MQQQYLDGVADLISGHAEIQQHLRGAARDLLSERLEAAHARIRGMQELRAFAESGSYVWNQTDEARLAFYRREFERLRFTEVAPATVTEGFWRDIIHNRDGELVSIGDWNHNLVVNSFASLVAGWMIGNGAADFGTVYRPVQYMAVGTGLVGWDTTLPPPTLTDTQLTTEIARKTVTAQFVNGAGAVVAGPTANVLVTCTFNVGEANGTLREWGLFGGTATATVNSGLMVDHVTTPALNKPNDVNDFSLTRLVTVIL